MTAPGPAGRVGAEGGVLAWMATNPVAANLLMVLFLLGGLLVFPMVKQEVFPEIELDTVAIQVRYPGASPAEVEQGVLLAVEESVRGLDGVKRVTARANEGMGTVLVELMLGADANEALQDVKSAVDRVTTIPRDAERPVISLLSSRREVISVVLHGEVEPKAFRALVEHVRERILECPQVTYTELEGVRPLEIAVEVPHRNLRAYGLTLQDVAREIGRTAVEIPGGGVKAESGEVLLRTMERRDLGSEFATIPVLTAADGTQVRVGDLATVVDGFAETDEELSYEGRPAALIRVFRVGAQKPLVVAAQVLEVVERVRPTLPPGVGLALWRDQSEVYRDRIDLLLRNALSGLVLVLISLGLFLDPRLAFWVTLNIPVSIIGALLVLPVVDASVNMISLFAFIVTVGLVVDNGIVIGENIFEHRRRGAPPLAAAIGGVREVAKAVVFSSLTNMVAFVPLVFIPGFAGKLFGIMPYIVIPVFVVSLLECLLVLPCHLRHPPPAARSWPERALGRLQGRIEAGLQRLVERVYAPLLGLSLRWRYANAALWAAALALTVGLVAGGRIQFLFMPKVEGDQSVASLELPYGVAVESTRAVTARVVRAAQQTLDELGGRGDSRGILARIGRRTGSAVGPGDISGLLAGASHLAGVEVYLVAGDRRPFTAAQFTARWRELVGQPPGVEKMSFNFNIGPAAGAPIDVELRHEDLAVLHRAAADLARSLQGYAGLRDVDDGFARGKPQLNFSLKPEARVLGLRAQDLGRQLRDAFFGAEALRQQRGRNEVKVLVRLPRAERSSEAAMAEFLVRTPAGAEVPLAQAAVMDRSWSYTEIRRADGRRVVDVTADVLERTANAGAVLRDVTRDVLPELGRRYPGLGWGFEGEQRAQRESLESLALGFLVILVVIYALLAVPFKSYVQPLMIMVTIPYGLMGAVLGHVLMGYELNVISVIGMVALAGYVINDAIVLVDAANEARRAGAAAPEAITSAARRRFRPILLTSVTTFLGLMPMIFETSVQARFLIPMALSMGYGCLFGTLISYFLVPSYYLVAEDLAGLLGLSTLPEFDEPSPGAA